MIGASGVDESSGEAMGIDDDEGRESNQITGRATGYWVHVMPVVARNHRR